MNTLEIEALKIVLEFVERFNKFDEDKIAAQAAARLQIIVDSQIF